MTGFDSVAMVDWSGGADTGPRPRRDAIWAGLWRDGAATTTYLRNRAVAQDWLAALIAEDLSAGRRLLVGFDFPMGYPAGFAGEVVGAPEPLRLWDRFAEELARAGDDRFAVAARLNGLFPGEGPFWFDPTRTDHPGLPRRKPAWTHRLPERRLVERLAPGTFTCWQLGGAGSVGSQALTGCAVLSRLRAAFGAAIAVWPFGPVAAPVPVTFAEIWPSLISPEMRGALAMGEIRDQVQVRSLALTLAEMQRAETLAAAFDAATGPDLAEEGWIFGVGAEDHIRTAARAVLPA